MKTIQLGARLETVAALVREDVLLIDVGTDHGYLPVSLAERGKLRRAIAADVAAGPLSKAIRLIGERRLRETIEPVLADGLDGIGILPPCDIVMAGMGGELIASILDRTPQVRDDGVRLILQPMTKAAFLRRYLSEHGFDITEERLACEDGRLYQILACRYTGQVCRLSDCELEIGRPEGRQNDPLLLRLIGEKLETVRRIAEGKRSAGLDCRREDELAAALTALLSDGKECGETK